LKAISRIGPEGIEASADLFEILHLLVNDLGTHELPEAVNQRIPVSLRDADVPVRGRSAKSG
jgi:hypothetical protein